MKSWPKGTIACLCCRVGDPYWNGMPGSQQRNCYNCNSFVWVSPATLVESSVDKTEFLCMECHAEYVRISGKPTALLPISPAQIQERIDSGRVQAPFVGDVRKIKPTREQFVESYVAVKVNAGVEKDTPELRRIAEGVYDILVDNSPEGNKAFLDGLKQVCGEKSEEKKEIH